MAKQKAFDDKLAELCADHGEARVCGHDGSVVATWPGTAGYPRLVLAAVGDGGFILVDVEMRDGHPEATAVGVVCDPGMVSGRGRMDVGEAIAYWESWASGERWVGGEYGETGRAK